MAEFIGGRKILLVGGGNMGEALLKGWLGKGLLKKNVAVIEKREEARSAIKKAHKIIVAEYISEFPKFTPDIIFLAVKPQQMAEILPEYAKFSSGVFISIAAGITLELLKKYLGNGAKIVRAMPNLAVTIGEGATVAVQQNLDAAERKIAEQFFSAVGFFKMVDDEKLLNPVTAISGSGPAYIFYFAECLMAAAEELGLEKNLARELVLQTLKGAALLAYDSDKPALELRKNVTSPGGTTEAAFNVLNKDDRFKTLIKEAVKAASSRAEELAK